MMAVAVVAIAWHAALARWVIRHAPAGRSHTLSVLGDAETTRCPAGVTAHAVTPLAWPSRVAPARPVARAQTLSVRSSDAETTRRPSGVTVHAVTQPAWPTSSRTSAALSRVATCRTRRNLDPTGTCNCWSSSSALHPSCRSRFHTCAAVASGAARSQCASRASARARSPNRSRSASSPLARQRSATRSTSISASCAPNSRHLASRKLMSAARRQASDHALASMRWISAWRRA
jgi:hypothetical protein